MKTAITVPEKNVTPVRLDPAWDRARELLEMGRACASELAIEIERLRAAYLHRGQGGDRRGSSFTSVKLETLSGENRQGFTAQLRDQLGLHPQQAVRIMEAADYQRRIERVACAEIGEEIAWEAEGQRRTLTITAEHKEQAKQAVAGMALPGAPRPSRAWAGIMGEGTRVGVKNAGKADRQPVNHALNIARGLTALQTSLPHWAELTADERYAIEESWAKLILPLLPQTFAVSVK